MYAEGGGGKNIYSACIGRRGHSSTFTNYQGILMPGIPGQDFLCPALSHYMAIQRYSKLIYQNKPFCRVVIYWYICVYSQEQYSNISPCYCQIAATVEQGSGRMLSNKLASDPTFILRKLGLAVNILVGLKQFLITDLRGRVLKGSESLNHIWLSIWILNSENVKNLMIRR